jgi:hypothetical protein
VDQIREVLRYHHYAYKTEQAYVSWIVRFVRFSDTRQPAEVGRPEIERFLSHLAINRAVAATKGSRFFSATRMVRACWR